MKKKLPKVATKVANDDIAIAGLVVKPNKAIPIATMMPPPPMPAMVRPTFTSISTMIPNTLMSKTGKTGLWTQ